MDTTIKNETPATQTSPIPFWKRVKSRLVLVLDKSRLKEGQMVKMADGTIYKKDSAGTLIRVSPLKPYANRAEQKKYNRWRREQRELQEQSKYGTYDSNPSQA
jgi:hypothetical protein